MPPPPDVDTHWRTAVKSFSWRCVATLSTLLISLLIQGDLGKALLVTGPDFLFKYFTFYAHERLYTLPFLLQLEYRTLLKLVTWKIVAVSITVTITSYVNGGDWRQALSIGGIDSALKTLTLYLHEQAWAISKNVGRAKTD